MKNTLKKLFTLAASLMMVLSMSGTYLSSVFAQEAENSEQAVLTVISNGMGSVDVSFAEETFTIPSNETREFNLDIGEKVTFKAYTDGNIDDISLNDQTITEYEQNQSTLEFEKEIMEDSELKVSFGNPEEAEEQETVEIQNESAADSGVTGEIVSKVYIKGARDCFLYWEINVGGNIYTSYCGYPESAGPKVGMKANVFEVSRELCPADSYMAKALYYLDTDEAPIIETLCQEQMHTMAGQSTPSDAYYLYTHGQMDSGWYKKTQAKKAELDAMDPVPDSFKIYGVDYYALDELGKMPIINTSKLVHYQVLFYGVRAVSGELSLKKSSSDTTVDKDNTCYSLEGTEYGVYSDMQCTNSIGTLTVDAEGNSNTLSLSEGIYYVKETKAGKGYALDTKVYTAQVKSGETNTIEVKDAPVSDPVLVVVEKKDQSGKRLKDAQFTVKYYNAYYDVEPDAEPTRQWILKTNEKGQAALTKELLVTGDEFYYTPGGDASFPLGTVVIYESKAPEGYTLDGTTKHIIKIGLDQTGKIVEYNAPVVTDYKVTVSKRDVAGDEVKGASMQVVDKDGNVVDSWISDGNVHTVNSLVDGESYVIQEKVAADGYVKATDIPFTAGKTDQHIDVIDKIYSVAKVDDDNEPVIGAKLQILDMKRNVVDEWTTTEEVHYVSNLCERESYILHEEQAPEGYLPAEDQEFTVSKEKRNEGFILVDHKEISIRIHKKDEHGRSLSGVEYSIEFKEKESDEYTLLDKYTTDKDGEIFVEGLASGFYRITEIKTAAGMNLLAEPIEIELPYEDEEGKMCYQAEFEITDSVNLVMPSTGADPIGKAFMIGCALLISVAFNFMMEDNKKMNRKMNGE